jgi:hypothetical protein
MTAAEEIANHLIITIITMNRITTIITIMIAIIHACCMIQHPPFKVAWSGFCRGRALGHVDFVFEGVFRHGSNPD